MDLTKKNAFSDENLNDLFDLIHVAVDRQSVEGKALSKSKTCQNASNIQIFNTYYGRKMHKK